jgi:hypothetical protein
MKILYITTPDPRAQGDFQENILLHGLRKTIGKNVIDYPRKKIMYGDFSETSRDELHGRGFTLYSSPLEDLNDNERMMEDIDVILYGVTNAYGVTDYHEINKLAKNVWYVDGHDDPNIQKTPCFKRELFNRQENVYPTGFGIPSDRIRPINLLRKTQLFQKTAPKESYFLQHAHGRGNYHYEWNQENAYYEEMQNCWFGLTCKKGGWDSLRHYEIMAAGSLLLFKDYDKKPVLCPPENLPTFYYSSPEELHGIMNSLVVNNKPTKQYIEMLFEQREWLLKYGTTEARALQVLKILNKEI